MQDVNVGDYVTAHTDGWKFAGEWFLVKGIVNRYCTNDLDSRCPWGGCDEFVLFNPAYYSYPNQCTMPLHCIRDVCSFVV